MYWLDPNCFAANAVSVQLTNTEMIQHTSYIFLTVLKYWTLTIHFQDDGCVHSNQKWLKKKVGLQSTESWVYIYA